MSDAMDKRVDEDWKRRAQAEKERLDAEMAPPSGTTATGRRRGKGDFIGFASSLAAQTAVFLGLEPDPMTGGRHVNLEQARYLIDTLDMLEDRTRGNLDEKEAATFKQILQELKMAYVEMTNAARAPKKPR